MKVLHVAEVIKGGVSSVMNELLLSQIKNDNIERVCCLIPDSQRDELNIGDSHIYTFKRNGRNLLSFIFFVWMFIRTVIKEKPTIIHLHSTFAGLFGRTVLILLPFYKGHVIYCPHAFSFMMAKSKWKLNLFAIVERFLSKFTDAIICVSNYEKEIAIVNGIPKEKLFTIYNGVSEVEHIDKLPKSDLFNILYVGRFDYQKGFDRLEKIINGLNYSSSN
ncbi:glycosyltransferase, partial [Klebsiella quasipneumoniae]